MEQIRNNAAYIIERIKIVHEKAPGKKTLQKLIFLIEQTGINLQFDYGLHFYGPYSATLDAAVTTLNTEGILNFDYSGYSHRMAIDEKKYDVSPDNLSDEQIKKIDEIIIHFKERSPSDLELLTTAIYAFNNLAVKTQADVINGVQKIKGTKYSQNEILEALNDFDFFGKSFAG